MNVEIIPFALIDVLSRTGRTKGVLQQVIYVWATCCEYVKPLNIPRNSILSRVHLALLFLEKAGWNMR